MGWDDRSVSQWLIKRLSDDSETLSQVTLSQYELVVVGLEVASCLFGKARLVEILILVPETEDGDPGPFLLGVIGEECRRVEAAGEKDAYRNVAPAAFSNGDLQAFVELVCQFFPALPVGCFGCEPFRQVPVLRSSDPSGMRGQPAGIFEMSARGVSGAGKKPWRK